MSKLSSLLKKTLQVSRYREAYRRRKAQDEAVKAKHAKTVGAMVALTKRLGEKVRGQCARARSGTKH